MSERIERMPARRAPAGRAVPLAQPRAATGETAVSPLLAIEGLTVDFETRGRTIRAVDGVSLSLAAGETLVVLGESGSGKSVTALAAMGLLEPPPLSIVAGQVRFDGVDLVPMEWRDRRRYCGCRIAMIFQDALSALNPVLTVGYQITEVIREHTDRTRREARAQAVALMERVRIPAAPKRFHDYPHQFSGGMRQRVMIAMALAVGPDVLIADEPTTALDVTVQAQIMSLLVELQQERSMALLLITHDLGVAAEIADRIVVMYAGRVVESAPADDLYARPAHFYTAGLLRSVPDLERERSELTPIAGSPPSPTSIPAGCAFHPRCPRADDRCRADSPALAEVATAHWSACHHAGDVTDVEAALAEPTNVR